MSLEEAIREGMAARLSATSWPGRNAGAVAYEAAQIRGIRSSDAPATTIDCDHCGDVAITSEDGLFGDGDGGRCMTCGYPGHVTCDSETPAEWSTGQEATDFCALHDCTECNERRRDLIVDWGDKRVDNASSAVPYPPNAPIARDDVRGRLCALLNEVWEHFDPQAHEANDCTCSDTDHKREEDFRHSAQSLRWVESVVRRALKDEVRRPDYPHAELPERMLKRLNLLAIELRYQADRVLEEEAVDAEAASDEAEELFTKSEAVEMCWTVLKALVEKSGLGTDSASSALQAVEMALADKVSTAILRELANFDNRVVQTEDAQDLYDDARRTVVKLRALLGGVDSETALAKEKP